MGISFFSHVNTHSLVWVLESVIHDGHQSQPSLLGSGDDLIGRQDEAVATCVPKLKCVRVLDALVVGPVNCATAGLIYNQNKHCVNSYMVSIKQDFSGCTIINKKVYLSSNNFKNSSAVL